MISPTLAHEMGHAVHRLMASHHRALTADASLPLAETASTFGEMVLVDHLMAVDPDPDVQRDLLFAEMDDAYATIGRQAYFALFEREAHTAVQGGASVDELCALYMDNLKAQFGETFELNDDFRFEWLSIPHIYHTPFYVYAYAFGQLLVLALYQQYCVRRAPPSSRATSTSWPPGGRTRPFEFWSEPASRSAPPPSGTRASMC